MAGERAPRAAKAGRVTGPDADPAARGRRQLLATAGGLSLAACASPTTPRAAPSADAPAVEPTVPLTVEQAVAQVRAAESAFAGSMAARQFDRFSGFVADDAVFVNGGAPLRGKPAVLAFWQRFFEGPVAPFAWEPRLVEANALATLAYSEGPVFDPAGKATGKFFSTWRREPDGRWRVVFDNGYFFATCAKP
jgi:ketosteroid isomerase-like protein